MDKKVISIMKVVGVGALLVGAGALAGAQLFPKTVEKQVEVIKEVTVEKIVPRDVFVDKIVEVTKEVKVDNGNLGIVLEHIYDNNGNIEYITEDLDDDELDLIVDRVVLVNDFKALALNEVKKNLFDEADGMIINGTTLDDRDLERLKLNDDADEITVDEIDFEDKDAELIVTGEFEQDDIEYDFEARVIFKDGEVDELEIDSITQK